MSRLSAVVLSALIGATLALPAAAQWKWRDKAGHVQYSDLPPPAGVADADILQRPNAGPRRSVPASAPPPLVAASAAVKTVEPELEAKQRKAEQEQAARKKAEEEKAAAARADNCVRAQGQLRTLNDGIRIVRTNEKGEREFLDDKQRADEVRRMQDIIASDCKR